MDALDELCVNTLRFLSVDMIEAAKSGHPGLPLGAAPMAYVLWTKSLKHNPKNPFWWDRDRFILSAGHGSALLYSLLHLTGYGISLDDLKNFRQWGSNTPGHPEVHLSPGVEATTGPLGQGFAMGVGMAIAEKFLSDRFNRGKHRVVDHRIYAIVSDGDLMEGVASEAASLAGTMGLGRLIYLYDDNGISLEGPTGLSFTEDVAARFRSYGWNVLRVQEGNDIDSIERAIDLAKEQESKPSLIIIRTHIGYGSPKQDTKEVHGEPLGTEALAATRSKLGWGWEQPFCIPDEACEEFAKVAARGVDSEEEWAIKFAEYKMEYSDLAAEYESFMNGALPLGWENSVNGFDPKDGPMATRDASSKILNQLAKQIKNLLGGSADLAPSTKTLLSGEEDMGLNGRSGRNIHFGVREHAMGAILNGMALHGGVIPYGATFLTFSDYERPAIRLASLMNTHTVFIFTHDSVALGEDGPTHQPIEHLWALRVIPGVTVIRPADANETIVAWKTALKRNSPVALVFSRQKLPVLENRGSGIAEGASRGGYILSDPETKPSIILMATGSEVHLIKDAANKLADNGISARVVSMPSLEIFDEQPAEYRDNVLPENIPRLAVEAGSPAGWWKYVGRDGDVIGLSRFGASAPGAVAMQKLGFNVENVVGHALALLNR